LQQVISLADLLKNSVFDYNKIERIYKEYLAST